MSFFFSPSFGWNRQGESFFVPFNILYFFNTFYGTRMLQFFRDIYVYKYYNYYVLNKIYNLFDSTASSKE